MIYAGIDITKSEHVIGALDDRSDNAARPMSFSNSTSRFEKCSSYLEGQARAGRHRVLNDSI